MADDDPITEDRLTRALLPLLKRFEEQLAAQHDLLREMQAVLTGHNPGLEFGKWWEQAWAAVHHDRYVWNYAKDRAQIKRLLGKMSLDELKARATAYLANDEPFLDSNRHPLGVLVSTINSYSPAPRRGRPPVDCRHTPRCASDVEHTKRQQQTLRGLSS